MKIGICMGFPSKNFYGGVTVQSMMWHQGLLGQGNEVYLMDNWTKQNWESFDWIIIVGSGPLFREYINLFQMEKVKIASAPIIDYPGSPFSFGLRGRFQGSKKIGWFTPIYDEFHLKDKISLHLVRSKHESKFLTEGLGISPDLVRIVPLHFRINKDMTSFEPEKKEDFVFHSSRLFAPQKNVKRLIDAAVKYNFNLVLAGTINGDKQRYDLNRMIDGHLNIKYVGKLSDEELVSYYKRAKVFALPSTLEGVGMVALEAAVNGCNIVLTELGAPKEYFNGKAFLCNPYSVDDIGRKVLEALKDKDSQPSLRNYLLNNNSEEKCMELLNKSLLEFLNK